MEYERRKNTQEQTKECTPTKALGARSLQLEGVVVRLFEVVDRCKVAVQGVERSRSELDDLSETGLEVFPKTSSLQERVRTA